MNNIERCQKCILPTTLPSVNLDTQGICNHCRDYERNMAKWIETKQDQCNKWEKIVDDAKNKKRRYDCLVPLSGGKDSAYALYVCTKLYGMNCLTVTFDNGYLTQQAKVNIRRVLDVCNADHMTFRISRQSQLKLYKYFISQCGSFCGVCTRGIGESIEKASRTFNIPLIVTGCGYRVSYLAMIPELFQLRDQWIFSKIAHESPIMEEAKRLGAVSHYARLPRLFFRIERKLRNMMGPKNENIYDYIDIDRGEVLKTVIKELGWQQMDAHFEHTDCGLHSVVGYIHSLRFPELTSETVHLAGQIRFGEMNREEAIKKEEDLLRKKCVPEELEKFLNDIEMTRAQFELYVSDWQSALKSEKK